MLFLVITLRYHCCGVFSSMKRAEEAVADERTPCRILPLVLNACVNETALDRAQLASEYCAYRVTRLQSWLTLCDADDDISEDEDEDDLKLVS